MEKPGAEAGPVKSWMRRVVFAGLGGLLVPSPGSPMVQRPARHVDPQTRFLVYYGDDQGAAIRNFDVLVLEAELSANVLRSAAPGATKFGYLSLCEINLGRSYAARLAAQGLLLFPNEHWNNAWFVELRDPQWLEALLGTLIPALLERGFDGLFIDTLDDADYLEMRDSIRFSGMRDAAVKLLRAIRRRYPNVPIMINRGYALVPRIIDDIDMLMGESVRSTYDASRDAYVLTSAEAHRWQCDRLREARQLRKSLGLFSLDYWRADDPAGIARLHAEARNNGFASCVATIDLQRIVAAA